MNREYFRNLLINSAQSWTHCLACWEGGAAAHNRIDQYSDLDLIFYVDDETVEETFKLIESALVKVGKIQHQYRVPEPSSNGHSQCFYQMASMPDYFFIDIAILKRSSPNNFLENERHGIPVIHFDRLNIIKPTSVDDDTFRIKLKERIKTIQSSFPIYKAIAIKEVLRKRSLDALAFYRVLTGYYVELLGIKYRPYHYDFGLRYAHLEFPIDIQKSVEYFCFVSNLEEIDQKLEALSIEIKNLVTTLLPVSDSESYIQKFHEKHPSCTPLAFASGSTDEGINSYQFLVDVIKTHEKKISVLDLACGDGALSKVLLNKFGTGLELTGIDISRSELQVAKKNFSNYPVKLIEANAKNIPLPSNSQDYILCHMAFMLMDEIDQVVSEIYRCLKPGGTFSAIVGGKSEKSKQFEKFLNLLSSALKDENKNWLSDLGDPRTRKEDGLRSLFNSDYFEDVEIENFKLQFSDKPENMMNFFMLMYDVDQLSDSRRNQLYNEYLDYQKSICDGSGNANHFIWLRRVSSKKK
jgi:ubiquinone/menaquinone biosynthesis C-methylase UbiE